jgi:acyl-CoA thioester hydrolase
MNKTPESKATIRFQDCDPFGHLNNSKYIDYMFNAREDQLIREYGLNLFEMAHFTKKAWVSAQTEIVYLKPTIVMEEVVIQTSLIEFSDRHVTAEAIMFEKNKKHIKSVMWAKFFHFDLAAQKGIKHADEFMELFAQLHHPVIAEKIDQRALNLSKGLRAAVTA